MLLNDSDLIEMGILEKGPRVLILSIIDKMRATEPPIFSLLSTGGPSSDTLTRQIFEDDAEFRQNILYKILDLGLVPEGTDLHWMSRIACQPLLKRVFSGGG